MQALADVATIALMQERTIRRAEELTEQLQGALISRVVIEQAKGALAALPGISPEEAFEVLRDTGQVAPAAPGGGSPGGAGRSDQPGESPRAE